MAVSRASGMDWVTRRDDSGCDALAFRAGASAMGIPAGCYRSNASHEARVSHSPFEDKRFMEAYEMGAGGSLAYGALVDVRTKFYCHRETGTIARVHFRICLAICIFRREHFAYVGGFSIASDDTRHSSELLVADLNADFRVTQHILYPGGAAALP